MTHDERAVIVEAVEAAIRQTFAHSAPATDEEWRRDAEAIADRVIPVLPEAREQGC